MGLISNPASVLNKADRTGKLSAVDETLGQVRGLLTELEEELALLRQVPEIAAKVEELHRIASAST